MENGKWKMENCGEAVPSGKIENEKWKAMYF
jgi:hypothetical protein